MISVLSIWKDVEYVIAKEENGLLGTLEFNSFSKRAELSLLNFLTGGTVPESQQAMFSGMQKSKDWLLPFIKRVDSNVSNGKLQSPTDYYTYENMYLISGDVVCAEDNDDDKPIKKKFNSIKIFDTSSKFDHRSRTKIKALKPSINKPIAKMVDGGFEFMPEDLGSIRFEYIRTPKFAMIGETEDPIYRNMVATKINDYEWSEGAREYFVRFIVGEFSIKTRDAGLMNQNIASKRENQ